MKTLTNPSLRLYLMLAVLFGVTLSNRPAHAKTVTDARGNIGRVVSIRGTATVKRRAADTTNPITRGTRLRPKDTVTTGRDSAVRVLLADRSVIDMGASSTVNLGRINVTPKRRKVTFRLKVGRVWARVSDFFGRGSEFECRTNNAVAGVRGTELIVEVDAAGNTIVTVVSGAAEIASLSGDRRKDIKAMMTATFDGTGVIELKPADAARIKAIAAAMAPRPKLSPMDLQSLRKKGLAPGLQKPARVEPARLDLIDTPAPPLDGEPGAFGTVDVRGKAEFKD